MHPVTTITLSTFDTFSLLSSIASLVLAIISIWLAVHFFIKSKNAEKEASNLLTKIGVQTEIIQKVSNKMLDKYVTYSTQAKPADEAYVLLAQVVQGTLSQGLPSNGDTFSNQRVMQELTTVYIAAMYYSALLNLYLQNALPDNIGEVESDMPWLKTVLDRSHFDFEAASNWLNEHGNEYISASPARQYYDEITSMDAGSVMDTFTAYSQRANT